MDDFVNAGYHARRGGDEAEEIRLFKTWCKQESVPQQDYQAEISWENRLSELKWRNAESLGWNNF